MVITYHPLTAAMVSIEGLYVWGVMSACVRARRSEDPLPMWLRVLVLLWGVVWPMLLLVVATVAFLPEYQTKGEHWIHYANDGWAGATIWPVFVLASFVLTDGLFTRAYLPGQRFPAFLAGVTLALISGWYAYATAFLDATEARYFGGRFLAVFPGLACVHYVLLAVVAWRMSEPTRNVLSQAAAWLGALAISFAFKYPLAQSMLAKLPAEVPPGYGDCFVVTAAAQGHPGFVGSWVDTASGRRVNDQLGCLRGLERLLRERIPGLHRGLRAVYNQIGPRVVRCIRFRIQADAVYVLLKPVEWSARGVLLLCGTDGRGRKFQGTEG